MAHGLAVEPPPSWDVRIYRRPAAQDEFTFAILHAGNFALPRRRGDFGSGAVELMRSGHVFVCLFEHEPEAARTPLFARVGMPTLRSEDFSPRMLQRTMHGYSGVQHFFQVRRRAFCLYVVLGDHRRRVALVREANRLLEVVSVR